MRDAGRKELPLSHSLCVVSSLHVSCQVNVHDERNRMLTAEESLQFQKKVRKGNVAMCEGKFRKDTKKRNLTLENDVGYNDMAAEEALQFQK